MQEAIANHECLTYRPAALRTYEHNALVHELHRRMKNSVRQWRQSEANVPGSPISPRSPVAPTSHAMPDPLTLGETKAPPAPVAPPVSPVKLIKNDASLYS